jgi:hypothetical protein
VSAALVVVVTAPAVARASQDQETQTIKRLAEDVNSAEPKVRRAALKALASRGAEALEPLSLLVGDPERDIRSDAIGAIVAIYVEPPPREHVSSAEEAFGWTRYRTTPWAVPPALVTNLVRALADDWSSVRRDAAYTLGVVMTPPIDARVADELIYSLADPDSSVRLAAVKSLGRLRATRAGDQLIGRIVDPDLPVVLPRCVRLARSARRGRWSPCRSSSTTTAGRRLGGRRSRLWPASRTRQTANLFAEERFSKSEAHRRYAYEGIARIGVADADAVAMEQLLTEERDEAVGRGHGVRPGGLGQAVLGSPRTGAR